MYVCIKYIYVRDHLRQKSHDPMQALEALWSCEQCLSSQMRSGSTPAPIHPPLTHSNPYSPFHFHGLREELVRLLQHLRPLLLHEAHHVVESAVLLVHVHGEILLVHGQVQLLRLLQVALALQLLRLVDVQQRHLTLADATTSSVIHRSHRIKGRRVTQERYLAHVAHCDLVRDLPVAQLGVHLHGEVVLALGAKGWERERDMEQVMLG
jgi:hypothetical protein